MKLSAEALWRSKPQPLETVPLFLAKLILLVTAVSPDIVGGVLERHDIIKKEEGIINIKNVSNNRNTHLPPSST